MFKFLILFTTLIFFTTLAHGKKLSEYMTEVEPLLLEGKYEEANEIFNSFNIRVKSLAINGETLDMVFEDTVAWMKNIDKVKNNLKHIESNMMLYEANGDYNITTKNCKRNCEYFYRLDFDKRKARSLPFSKALVYNINQSRNYLNDKFNDLNERLNSIQVEEKNKILEERNIRIKLKKEKRENELRAKELARKNKTDKENKAISYEVDKIDALSKEHGYLGYANIDVASMIYKTQKKGNLKTYINKVIGCHSLENKYCTRWYPKIKAIQILDNQVLYSFSEYIRNEVVSFNLIVDKDPSKIYQEGQSLSNVFYVFEGMASYTTVLGIKKTVPSFKLARLIKKQG